MLDPLPGAASALSGAMNCSHAARCVERIVRVFALAVALDFIWEMAQMYLYISTGAWVNDWFRCASASAGGGGMILLIYASGAVVWHRSDWFRQPSGSGYVLMLVIGVGLAVMLEWLALRSGRWTYAPSMPRLLGPGSIGVLPVLQMVVVPPIVFRLAAIREG